MLLTPHVGRGAAPLAEPELRPFQPLESANDAREVAHDVPRASGLEFAARDEIANRLALKHLRQIANGEVTPVTTKCWFPIPLRWDRSKNHEEISLAFASLPSKDQIEHESVDLLRLVRCTFLPLDLPPVAPI